MSTHGHPFTVLQADLRLYTVDSDGDPLLRVFLGATAEQIELAGEYRPRAVQYLGQLRPVTYHEDESWSITAENVRLIDLSMDPPRPVRLERNVEYCMVIVWFDPDTMLWCKRCYFGVKAQPAMVSGSNVNQTLRFTAEEMTEIAGAGVKPGFDLVRLGEIYYVESGDSTERTLLYRYDPASFALTVVDESLLAGRAEIDTATEGELTITIDGEEALFADAAGVEIGELVAGGGTVLDDSPRLEFWLGDRRIASLSVDTLSVPDVTESATHTLDGANMEFANLAWLFTITLSQAIAPEFIERAA